MVGVGLAGSGGGVPVQLWWGRPGWLTFKLCTNIDMKMNYRDPIHISILISPSEMCVS